MKLLYVSALRWEARTVLRAIRHPEKLAHSRCWKGSSGDHEVVVMATGMGPGRAADGLRMVEAFGPFDVAVLTGCAAALYPEARTGEVVIAEEIAMAGGMPRICDREWSERLRKAAGDSGLVARFGRVVTTPFVVASSEEKRRLAADTGALAVEMEGAAVAEWADRRGVKFALARVILDTLEDELAGLSGSITPEGGIRPGAMWAAVLADPAIVLRLPALARARRRCQAALSALNEKILHGEHDG